MDQVTAYAIAAWIVVTELDELIQTPVEMEQSCVFGPNPEPGIGILPETVDHWQSFSGNGITQRTGFERVAVKSG